MKRLSIAVLTLLLFGLSLGGRLLAQAPGARPSLAILPLKEEGRKNLGDVSETMNMLVANAFADSGAFLLVERSQVLAALPAGKRQGAETDRRAAAELGRRLGAKYLLWGSYLPEYTLASGTVTVTMNLRLVNAADGKVVKSFQEVGEGASLGSVVALLTRKLSAKAAPETAAPVVVPAPVAAAPAPAVVPVPVAAAPAPAVVPAPQAAPVVPVPVAAPAPAAAPAPPVAAAPAVVPAPPVVAYRPDAVAPVEPSAPSPRRTAKVLMVLREGRINGVYYQKGGLARFGAKLEDFEFLVKSVAKLFPAEVAVTFDTGTRGFGDDATLNRALVRKYQPDTLVIVSVECNTKSKGYLVLFSKSQIQAGAEIEFLAADTLEVLASRSVQTDFIQARGLSEAFPSELKDDLARRVASALPSLPY